MYPNASLIDEYKRSLDANPWVSLGEYHLRCEFARHFARYASFRYRMCLHLESCFPITYRENFQASELAYRMTLGAASCLSVRTAVADTHLRVFHCAHTDFAPGASTRTADRFIAKSSDVWHHSVFLPPILGTPKAGTGFRSPCTGPTDA